MVTMMEKEFDQIQNQTKVMGPQVDLIEVFCSAQSTLTEQVQHMGGRAIRFGLSQGNLQDAEGRKSLFTAICRHQPKHVWMSPICKPWSSWSNLNSQKSVEMWDRIQSERRDVLSQVALCLVLCRIQHRCRRHAHWEQPKGSHMFLLPYLVELFRYMLGAKPDMCTAGNLRDPQNDKPMKKGMHILTSSRKIHDMIDHLRCPGNHEHQPIEGATRVHGQGVLRSVFSERYPRKFARLIAKGMIQKQFPVEQPVGSLCDPALIAIDQWFKISSALAADARMAKKSKVPMPRQAKATAADRSLESSPNLKRRRVKQPEKVIERNPKEEDSSHDQNELLQEIMNRVESQLPRVGKQVIDDPILMSRIQMLFPEKVIRSIVACKGTERTMAPPESVSSREAPYRRAIMKLRTSGKVITDSWEKYDELSKRKVIRKSYPCRVNITVFAANSPTVSISHDTSVPAPEPAVAPTSRMEGSDNPMDPPIGQEKESPPTAELSESPQQNETRNSQKIEVDHGSQIPMEQGTQPNQDNRFLALPKEEQAMLRRAHQNLCHPSPEQMSAVLKLQGARPEITQAVFDMKCNTCAAHQQPKVARPSTLKCELDFNDKVFIDGITWTSKAGKMFHFYHILDQATNFHVAVPAPCRAAEQAIQCVSESWFQWAGPPNTMVTDAGTEFTSEAFTEFLQRHDVKSVTAAPHAHWQNGRCERHGKILQSMLNRVDHEMPIQTYKELQQALVQCNTLSIRQGFSPEVLVFGKSSRLPGSLSSCSSMSSLASADRDDAQGIAFRKSLFLREQARIAFHQADNNMALRRACLRRTRPDRQGYAAGEWVMLWQPETNGGHWFGPLKVVAQEGSSSIWATQGGKLYRRALEHVRPVCSSEANEIPTENNSQEITSQNNPMHPEIIPSDDHQVTHNHNNPEIPVTTSSNNDAQSQSQEQPDDEPEAISTPPESIAPVGGDPAVETPVPDSSMEDDLVTTHLLCCEDVIMQVDPDAVPCAWRCEVEVPQWMNPEDVSTWNHDEIPAATTEKKQRTEVKLTALNAEEREAFAKAKDAEVQNWLKTGTVSKILRNKLAPELSLSVDSDLETIGWQGSRREKAWPKAGLTQAKGSISSSGIYGPSTHRSTTGQSHLRQAIKNDLVATDSIAQLVTWFV